MIASAAYGEALAAELPALLGRANAIANAEMHRADAKVVLVTTMPCDAGAAYISCRDCPDGAERSKIAGNDNARGGR